MIKNAFRDVFGSLPMVQGFTPGRVNLMGEHTDYNGGMVLPTALPLGVSIALSHRDDNKIRIVSDTFEDTAQRTLSDTASGHWSDYVTGAVIAANCAGLLSGGADVAIKTTLPLGAGISSSAAVTVGILKCAREFADAALTDTEISVLARRIENEFIGVPCGIMDQMAVAIARPGQALALNTKTLDFECVDLPADYHMAVIHSGVYRQLNEGRYKVRKEECDAIKTVLRAKLGHDDICLMSDADLTVLNWLSETLQRRARHCVTDHRRVLKSVACLRAGDIAALGQYMTDSHNSMRDDFEITVPKVDRLVEDATAFGALGARQTGGGFGGCIVACVEKAKLGHWKDKLLLAHSDAFWVA